LASSLADRVLLADSTTSRNSIESDFMLHLIGILVLSSQLLVAVETKNGFVEASFANTSAGVEELIEFAENSLSDLSDDDGTHIIVGRLDDTADRDLIIGKLASLGIPHGYATSTAIRASAEQYKLGEHSPKAVALAFRRPAGNNRPN
jgi:hypothetical protein